MPDRVTQEEIENSFRSSLTDLIAVAEKLTPYCQTTGEMIDMAKHAIENDGQLRLLLSLMKDTKGK